MNRLAGKVQRQRTAPAVLDHGCPVTNGNARVANFVAVYKRGVSSPALSLNRFVLPAVDAMEDHAALRLRAGWQACWNLSALKFGFVARRASVKFAMTRALSASESKSIVEMVEAIKQNAALVSFGTLWEACICARLIRVICGLGRGGC